MANTNTKKASVDFRAQLKRMEGDSCMFEAITIGSYIFSIQGSYAHYCSPQETLPSGTDYHLFEVMLFPNIDKKSRYVIHPNKDNFLRDCLGSNVKFFRSEDGVGGYVSYKTIQNMLDSLRACYS
jgi:hypothetical protein